LVPKDKLNLLKRNEYRRRPGKGANEDERYEENDHRDCKSVEDLRTFIRG